METAMRVLLLSHTPDAARIVAAAARNCYSADGPTSLMEGMDDAEAERYIEKVASLGHESVMEHAVFTFAAENVSRTLMAQLTRHRLASFSVKSQRYVNEENFAYVVPDSVRKNPDALDVFMDAMSESAKGYAALREMGIPKEDARFLLPGACATHIVFTMNARELLHFFRLRCCERAQWEIRRLATEMLLLCQKCAPVLFCKAGPRCVWEQCGEGTMSCGQSESVRARFRAES